MPSGEAPTVETGTVQALRERPWSRRPPPPRGLVSLLTLGFWAVWLYLVMPLISLLLWAFGIRLFVREISQDGYEGLRASLIAYSSILLTLVGLLVLWILWNVVRYGGRHDRRTAKRAEVSDEEVQRSFHLDGTLLETMRTERIVRIDLDRNDCVLMLKAASPPGTRPIETAADGAAAAPRERIRA